MTLWHRLQGDRALSFSTSSSMPQQRCWQGDPPLSYRTSSSTTQQRQGSVHSDVLDAVELGKDLELGLGKHENLDGGKQQGGGGIQKSVYASDFQRRHETQTDRPICLIPCLNEMAASALAGRRCEAGV